MGLSRLPLDKPRPLLYDCSQMSEMARSRLRGLHLHLPSLQLTNPIEANRLNKLSINDMYINRPERSQLIYFAYYQSITAVLPHFFAKLVPIAIAAAPIHTRRAPEQARPSGWPGPFRAASATRTAPIWWSRCSRCRGGITRPLCGGVAPPLCSREAHLKNCPEPKSPRLRKP